MNRRLVHLNLSEEAHRNLNEEAHRHLGEYRVRRRTLLAEALTELEPPALADLARAMEHLRRLEDLIGRVKH